MNYYLMIGLGFSVYIAGILSIFRFKEIRSVYYPFVILIWTACINETLNFILTINHQYNIVNSNIYDLVESVLLLWFFKKMGAFSRYKIIFNVLLVLFIGAWIYENFLFRKFGTGFDSYFIIIYSFPIVILSINTINKLLLSEKELMKNAGFLICIAMIIFFTYRGLVETFWFYGLGSSTNFQNNVFAILVYINLLCNLIYAIAILWMRKKQAFSLRF